MEDEDEKEGSEVVTLVDSNEVVDGYLLAASWDEKGKLGIHAFDCMHHAGGKLYFINLQGGKPISHQPLRGGKRFFNQNI